MDEKNPIYEFLKAEGMTDLSEQDFISKYTDRDNLQPVYEYLRENENTDLEFEPFADKYFPKSNEVSGQGSTATSVTSTGASQTSQSTSNQATLAEQSTGEGYLLPEGATDLTNPEEGIYAYYDPNLVNVDTGEMGDVVNRLEAVEVTSPVVEAEKELNEPTPSMWENVKNSVAQVPAIFNQGILGTPEYLYNLAAIPQNFLADLFNADFLRADYRTATEGSLLEDLTTDIVDDASRVRNFYQDQIQYKEADILSSIQAGNFLEAGTQVANGIITTAPSMLTMVVTGGVSNAVNLGRVGRTVAMSLPFASSSYQELQENENLSENGKLAVAGLNGLMEIIPSQSFGTARLIDDIMTGRAGQEQVKGFLTGYIDKLLKSNGIPATMVRGGIEEITTQASQNLIAIYSGAEPDLDPTAGLVDAFIIGSVADGLLSGGNKASKHIANPQSKARVEGLESEILQLRQDLDNANIDDSAKNAIQQGIESRVDEINSEVLNANEQVSNLSPENINRLKSISSEIDSIDATLNQGGESGSEVSTLSEPARQSLESRKQELNREVENILGQETTDTNESTEVNNEVPVESTEVDAVGTETETTQELVDTETDTVQQTETFIETEQPELVNTVENIQGVEDAPTFVNSIRNSLSDSNVRQNRIAELEQRFQQRRDQGSNLGITTDPRQEAQYWADVTEYAILKIADGTIRTARALAQSLNVDVNDTNLQKAFTDATEVNRIINEATVPEVRERPKTTIRRTTEGRIQGRVELTNKQALTNRIRTLNEGARLGKKAIVQARQDIKDLVSDLGQARAFRGTANASALRRVANFVNNANTPRQVERATEVIQKVVDDVAFGRKLASVDTYKQRIKRVARSKSTPKDLASVLRDFSNINPRDLEVNQLDEFLTLAESIYRRETSVSNVNNRELQRLVDIAEATRQREQESRAEAQAEPEAQERKIESLKERLVREAGVSEEVLTQIDNRSKPLDEIIQDLQETLNNSRESREERVRSTAKLYESEIKSVSQGLLDAQPNAEARGLLKGFLDANISVDNIPKSRLAGYVTTLYNLRNNNSIVGLGEYQVYNEAVTRTSNKPLVEKITGMFGTPSRLVQKLNELGASSGSATRIASLTNPRDIGQVESFTGFGDFYSKAQSVFVNTVAPFRKRVNDITTKYRRDLRNDPVSTSLLGIYSDVIQYRTSWDAERIQQEYEMRINAWGESLRMLEERSNPESGNYNSTFARDNKGSISNLRKALQKIATKTTNSDGETVWEPKVTQSQIWDMLPQGQKELYNFARETFDNGRDKFFAVSQYYGGVDVETDWVNYVPRSYSTLTTPVSRSITRTLNSGEVSINDIIEGPFTGSLIKENTGSGQSRLIDGNRLPKDKVLNHDFVNNFMNEALAVAYDSETTGERKLMSLMLDRERTGLKFKDEVPFDLFRSSVARKLLGDRRALMVHSMDQTVMNKVLAKTRLLGTAKALGGVFQIAKQASPLVEVASRVSPQSLADAMKLYTNKEARDRILESGNAQLRNISQYYKTPKSPNVNVSDKEVSRIREVLRTAGVKADDITNILAEGSLYFLQASDKFYSDLGYLAFYVDQAKKNGNGVVNLGKVDADAISYANSQNSIVMNESDQSQQGDFATNKLIRAINPFISFSVNSTNSLIISIDKLIRSTNPSDKAKYTKEVAGILGNKILFNAVGTTIRYLGIYSGGRIITEAIKNSDEPDEEKERLIQSVKDDVESRQKLNAIRSVGYALGDILYGGILQNQVEPLADLLTKPIVESLFNENYLLSAGYSDSQKYIESNPIKQLTAYMGTSGVFVTGLVDTYNLADKYFESDERYKERLYGELTADKNAVFVDPFYLDDESGMLGRPVWDEATNLTALVASSVSLLGASSQEIASLRRYSSSIANTIMKNENGVVTKKSVEDIVKEARRIREIKVYGVPITLDQEQIGWYLTERDKAVKRLYKKYKQDSEETRSEYEKSISKMADEDMQDLYYKTYRKQFDEQEALKIRKEDTEYTIQEMRLDYQKRRRNANR